MKEIILLALVSSYTPSNLNPTNYSNMPHAHALPLLLGPQHGSRLCLWTGGRWRFPEVTRLTPDGSLWAYWLYSAEGTYVESLTVHRDNSLSHFANHFSEERIQPSLTVLISSQSHQLIFVHDKSSNYPLSLMLWNLKTIKTLPTWQFRLFHSQ